LVNAADGSTLWSQHYDRPYKDLFALQDDISKSVAAALKAKLLDVGGAVVQSDRPPSGNLAAYNAFLQGRFYVQRQTEADQRKAIDYFMDATRIDPDYAAAWAVLGHTQGILAGNYVGGSEAAQTWEKARAAVKRALRLDANLASAHAAYTFILISADHDWKHAAAEAKRAYQLAPDKAYFPLATVQGALGNAQQAVDLLRHGLPTDPLCAGCYDYLARYLPALDQFGDATQAVKKALQINPESYFSRLQLTYIYAMQENAAAALQAAQQAPPGFWRDEALAMALQVGGDRPAADAALRTVIAKDSGNSAYQIAEIYALRRDPDNMFKWLERASRNRDPGIELLLTDPPVLRYKDDPRFAAFCKEVGLPTATDAKALP
jgi:tetratricopeptide (TPR) repeat protein